jgi:hypothetical protein
MPIPVPIPIKVGTAPTVATPAAVVGIATAAAVYLAKSPRRYVVEKGVPPFPTTACGL